MSPLSLPEPICHSATTALHGKCKHMTLPSFAVMGGGGRCSTYCEALTTPSAWFLWFLYAPSASPCSRHTGHHSVPVLPNSGPSSCPSLCRALSSTFPQGLRLPNLDKVFYTSSFTPVFSSIPLMTIVMNQLTNQ